MIDSDLWILDVLALDLWGFKKRANAKRRRKSKERLSRRRGLCKILMSENPPKVCHCSTTFMNPENCDCARALGQHLLQQRHDSSLSGTIMAQGTRPLPRNAEEPWIAPPKTLDSENRFSEMPPWKGASKIVYEPDPLIELSQSGFTRGIAFVWILFQQLTISLVIFGPLPKSNKSRLMSLVDLGCDRMNKWTVRAHPTKVLKCRLWADLLLWLPSSGVPKIAPHDVSCVFGFLMLQRPFPPSLDLRARFSIMIFLTRPHWW